LEEGFLATRRARAAGQQETFGDGAGQRSFGVGLDAVATSTCATQGRKAEVSAMNSLGSLAGLQRISADQAAS
jgi:hypothetical protein